MTITLQQETPHPPKGLGSTIVEYRSVAMIMKTGMKVAQDYTVFNYGPQIPQNNVKYQGRTIVEGTGVTLATIFPPKKQ